jgi:hypothetical protein
MDMNKFTMLFMLASVLVSSAYAAQLSGAACPAVANASLSVPDASGTGMVSCEGATGAVKKACDEAAKAAAAKSVQ